MSEWQGHNKASAQGEWYNYLVILPQSKSEALTWPRYAFNAKAKPGSILKKCVSLHGTKFEALKKRQFFQPRGEVCYNVWEVLTKVHPLIFETVSIIPSLDPQATNPTHWYTTGIFLWQIPYSLVHHWNIPVTNTLLTGTPV